MSKVIPMVGKKFGKLIVISFHHLHESGTTRYWLCKCDCGNFHIANGSNLRAGEVKSCGCLANSKNGETGGLLNIWNHILHRCMNPNDDHFMWYGFKGIKVCEEWKKDFGSFEKWALENGYKSGLTIDRVDPDGNYTPDNCKWITRKENSGKRKSRTKAERERDKEIINAIRGGSMEEREWQKIRPSCSTVQTSLLGLTALQTSK